MSREDVSGSGRALPQRRCNCQKKKKRRALGWGGGMGVECSGVGWRRDLMTLRTVEEGSVAGTDEQRP